MAAPTTREPTRAPATASPAISRPAAAPVEAELGTAGEGHVAGDHELPDQPDP